MATFDGKVALVTGAGTGIGYAICLHFARAGAAVLLNDVDGDLADRAAESINAEVGRVAVSGFGCNIADLDAVGAMIDAAVERFGRLDITVANAGVTHFGAFLDETPAVFDRLVSVNLRGSYFTAQAAARAMLRSNAAGRIILTASTVAYRPLRNMSIYGITKAGILMMAQSLALELGGHGITVNAIVPGATLTERTAVEMPDYAGSWGALIPTGTVATVEDIAAAVLFLASAEARQINGLALTVDGGQMLTIQVPADQP